jgi:hypothetical protein
VEVDLPKIELRLALQIALTVFVLALGENGADGRAFEVPVAGAYSNEGYRYSVAVPPGLHAYRPSAPAPQHGIRISLGRKGEDSIWINGEFDVLSLGSTEELAKRQAGMLADQDGLSVVANRAVTLGGAEAREVILENRMSNGRVGYVRFVLAFRAVSSGAGLVYVVGMKQKAETAAADSVFSTLLASFRMTE